MSQQSEMFYGKVLIVDDNYDETISKAISALVKKGLSVQYWDGKNDFPKTIRNVRVVILDLDLINMKIRPPGYQFYLPAVEALKKIPSPFLVVIMAIDFNNDDPENLEKAYKEFTGIPIHGFIIKEGLSKDEELDNPDRLAVLVISSIKAERIMRLILSWENVVDKAKDSALKDLVINEEIEGTVIALVNMYCKSLDEEFATRELINVMMRLVSRRINKDLEFQTFQELVNEINKEYNLLPPQKRPRIGSLISNKIMFYTPESEGLWTGDIYRSQDQIKYYNYAIILTPPCDLAHSKTKSARVCFGFPLEDKYLEDTEYPPYIIDPAILNGKMNENKSIIDYIKEKYIKGKDLPMSCYQLWKFIDSKENEKPIGICFDFNSVRSLPTENIEKWDRICRLDSPFIEEILEKYARYVFRIGAPDFNKRQ
jgi:hypothetical protein